MILMLQVRTEGVTDDVYKEGDIFKAYPDTYVPGDRELKRFLFVKMSDLPTSFSELEASEYTVGPGNECVLRRMRKYRIDWRSKLTSEEASQVLDLNVAVPIMEGRFTLDDISRK